MRITWHPIDGHANYDINRLGQIRSRKTGLILKPFDDCRGYLRVTLDGKNCKVHILVASHFVHNPDPETKTVVNHKRGNKHDNRASQLEWVTQSENIKHAWAFGLIKSGGGGEKMNIPKAIKIGGKHYSVEITGKLDLGKVNYSGEILYQDLVICVCPAAQGKMEADLLHEIAHGLLSHLGYSEHDEKKVEELASALYMLIQDNPALFAQEGALPHEDKID